MRDFLLSNWGNIATVLGFVITIWTLARTKTAAVAARDAAEATKSQVSRIDTMSECAAAIAVMDEIKRLDRAEAWEIVPDRYSALRRLLVSVQQLNPDLTPEQRTILGGTIVQFRTMENRIEFARAANRNDELDFARLNKIVTRQLDDVQKVMLSIRQAGI